MRTLYFCPVVSIFLLFFLAVTVADWISTILLHTVWPCSANLDGRSEMCCTRLAGNTGRKNDAKSAVCAPSHNFVQLYLLN